MRADRTRPTRKRDIVTCYMKVFFLPLSKYKVTERKKLKLIQARGQELKNKDQREKIRTQFFLLKWALKINSE